MIFLELCDRCKGEGKKMLPPPDRRGGTVPATWSEEGPCSRCKGYGYQPATPIGIKAHLAGSGYKGV